MVRRRPHEQLLELSGGAVTPHLLDLVEEIVAAGAGSKQLTRELVAFAHALPEDPASCDLDEVVTRCERARRPMLPRGVELDLRLEARLWRVTCAPAGVERAILNLALNARDAMPSGGRMTLTSANAEFDQGLVSAHPFMRRGPHVRLTVADSGSGMTPEVKAHAFEPFLRARARHHLRPLFLQGGPDGSVRWLAPPTSPRTSVSLQGIAPGPARSGLVDGSSWVDPGQVRTPSVQPRAGSVETVTRLVRSWRS